LIPSGAFDFCKVVALPFCAHVVQEIQMCVDLASQLSLLGYPGFAYLNTSTISAVNVIEFLLLAISTDSLDVRSIEALPWVLLEYWQLDFKGLVEASVKQRQQNRLGFLVNLARRVSDGISNSRRTNKLRELECSLNDVREDRECGWMRSPINDAEKRWMLQHRSKEARHWRVLTSLSPEHLDYDFDSACSISVHDSKVDLTLAENRTSEPSTLRY
jgi:hypothetical protein